MSRLSRVVATVAGLAVVASAMGACGRDVVGPAVGNHAAAAAQPSLDRSPGSGGSGGDPVLFLRPADGAPAVANPIIVFNVRKGEDTTVRMYYHRAHGGRDSIVFAEFRVKPRSLDAWPDGRRIQDGQSVRITMTLVDAERGIVEFQPAGLRFSTKQPARLKLTYKNSNPDVDRDGSVDGADGALKRLLHVICRETPDGPWFPLPSMNNTGSDEIEAPIFGFSGYAIAV